MPYKPGRPCSQPGCPKIIRGTSSIYCKEHGQEEQRRVDRARGTAAQRGYNSRWRKIRRMVLARQPVCQDPFGIHKKFGEVVASNEVDHIIPLSKGGTNRFDNLQGLCKSCHSTKTAREDGAFGMEGRGGGNL